MMCIVRSVNRLNYYFKVRACWVQYEAPIKLFVPTPEMLSYCSALAGKGSTKNKIRL